MFWSFYVSWFFSSTGLIYFSIQDQDKYDFVDNNQAKTFTTVSEVQTGS